MAVTQTLDNGRLQNIEVTGRGLTANLVEAASKVRLSSGVGAVTEMNVTFNDTQDLSVYRSGVLFKGATIRYGVWNMQVEDVSVGPGPIGPQLSINAPSRTVSRLRGQEGEKSWGTVDAASWVRDRAEEVGAPWIIQFGLGESTLFRNPPDDNGGTDTTWDVLTDLAREKGVWLFERGQWLVFGKPSWLAKNNYLRKRWDFKWDDWTHYSDGLAGMPAYTQSASQTPTETLGLRLVSEDADTIMPGDSVGISGTGATIGMSGEWIVTDVDLPFSVSSPVKVTCQRVIDPKLQPPRSAPKKEEPEAAPVAGRTTTTVSSGPAAASGLAGVVDRWVASVSGRVMDYDGAYGGQCVDLTSFYNRDVVGGATIFGNGNQWFLSPANVGAYQRISPNSVPQKGDIACWNAFYGGGYGHVAIVLENRGGSLWCLSQNPGPARGMLLSKQGLQGFLRPTRHK